MLCTLYQAVSYHISGRWGKEIYTFCLFQIISPRNGTANINAIFLSLFHMGGKTPEAIHHVLTLHICF